MVAALDDALKRLVASAKVGNLKATDSVARQVRRLFVTHCSASVDEVLLTAPTDFLDAVNSATSVEDYQKILTTELGSQLTYKQLGEIKIRLGR